MLEPRADGHPRYLGVDPFPILSRGHGMLARELLEPLLQTPSATQWGKDRKPVQIGRASSRLAGRLDAMAVPDRKVFSLRHFVGTCSHRACVEAIKGVSTYFTENGGIPANDSDPVVSVARGIGAQLVH